MEQKHTNKIFNTLGLNPKAISKKIFNEAMNIELEHGQGDDYKTMNIVLDHLKEYTDYYKRLLKLEKQAKKYWESNPKIKLFLDE